MLIKEGRNFGRDYSALQAKGFSGAIIRKDGRCQLFASTKSCHHAQIMASLQPHSTPTLPL